MNTRLGNVLNIPRMVIVFVSMTAVIGYTLAVGALRDMLDRR